MKHKSRIMPATGAALLISASATSSVAAPRSSPVGFSLESSAFSINLTGVQAEPLLSYPAAGIPQGAIAQPRSALQAGRVAPMFYAPQATRPGHSQEISSNIVPDGRVSPLVSFLPTDRAQSAIAISKSAQAAKGQGINVRVVPEVSVPILARHAAAKPITAKPVLVAMGPPAPSTIAPVATATAAAAATKMPALAPMGIDPTKVIATPTPLASRHKDLARLAQLEAELNRTDKRLSAAEEKISEGQAQIKKCGDTLRSAMMEAGPDARGLHPFVRVAQRYAGTPYVWGGESARGFDCSGFIIRVMRDLGYKTLPHSAAEQFNYGKPIARELMKPGDIVFFKNTYKAGISHVGIYLGKDRFIHAAGTGQGTIVSSLNEDKWRPGGKHYAGARRLIAARNG